MIAIGDTLRRERLRRNLDLDTISHELKISPRMLEAIEDERFDRLPGGVFAKAFVRQYARLLGLDEEEMANEVQRMLQPAGEAPQFAETERTAATPIQLPPVEQWDGAGESRFKWSSSLPALALVVVVMMGCAGVYSWWQRTRHSKAPQEAAAQTTAAPLPAETQAAANGQAAASPPASQPPAAEPKSAEPKPAEPKPAAAAPTPGAPSSLPAQPPSNPNAAVRVEVMAEEAVWVLARSDGKYLFSGTLEANQTRTVEANSTVLLRLGNAGGVSITLNGKPIGAVGPKGQVRTVQLTSGGFEIVAAPKPPAAPLEPLR